jgi:hypothetical protein
MQIKTKRQIITTMLTVLMSVFLIAGMVFAVTTIGNDISTDGNLTVSGTATLSGLLNADGGIAVDGAAFTVADITGNTSIAGILEVTGATTLGSLSAGDTSIGGTLTAIGNVTFGDAASDVFTVNAAPTFNTDITLNKFSTADATTTTYDSRELILEGSYWDGAASVNRDAAIIHDITATTPASQIGFEIAGTRLANITDAGALQVDTIDELTLDAGVTVDGVISKDNAIQFGSGNAWLKNRWTSALQVRTPDDLSYADMYASVYYVDSKITFLRPTAGFRTQQETYAEYFFDSWNGSAWVQPLRVGGTDDDVRILRGGDITSLSGKNFDWNGQIRIGDDTYAGVVMTDASGDAAITFTAHMGTTKPVVILTPELDPATDTVFAQITGWTQDASLNYIGVIIRTTYDGGLAEPLVPVHYLIIRKSAF